MWDRLEASASARVLDVGCGFGATLLAFARRHARGEERFVGLGINAYQVGRAREQADALGLRERCEFRVQSYDAPIEGSFDRVVSVEALLHSDELAQTLRGVAGAMAPGARLLAVEDVSAEALDGAAHDEDADMQLLCRAWFTPRIRSASEWRACAQAAGLEWHGAVDLSEQVPARAAETLARGERRLRRLKRVLPSKKVRGIADAFLGGVALERLYARGRLRYLAMDLRKAHA